MKFDLAFSNPPYNRSIDIKILKEVQPICEEMVIVHPSTWCIDRKMKTNLFNDFRTQINGKVKSVELFNGNPIFDINVNTPCMITHIKHNHKDECDVKFFEEEFKVKSIFDVTKFGEEWFTIVKPFMDKFIGCDSVWDHKVEVREVQEGKFYCQLADICGSKANKSDGKDFLTDDFYTVIAKNENINKGIRKDSLKNTYEFNTKVEQNIFIEYLKTDFARFCLALYKNNTHTDSGEMSLIPWLDFTQEWNDEKLFNHFNIDKETQDYIRNFLPDYYGIRK